MVSRSTKLSRPRPLVVIATDRAVIAGHAAHLGFHGYVRAVSEVAQALPLLLPAAVGGLDPESLIAGVDGVLLPGSRSNVAAERYGAPALPATTKLDPDR